MTVIAALPADATVKIFSWWCHMCGCRRMAKNASHSYSPSPIEKQWYLYDLQLFLTWKKYRIGFKMHLFMELLKCLFKYSLMWLCPELFRQILPLCSVVGKCSCPVNKLNVKELDGNLERPKKVDMARPVTDAGIIRTLLNVEKSKDIDKKSWRR